jgi:hypothetical protein
MMAREAANKHFRWSLQVSEDLWKKRIRDFDSIFE